VKTGLIIMLWGYFKKLVIADRISVIVDQVYGTPEQYGGVALIITTVLFAIQIYCDFSGYTDIAIGAAKIMGFDLMINFKRPFISKNISEFWRRWHISLSTWARDYIYEPIAFKRKNWGMKGIVWAIFVTFSLLGLWHGAKWAFVFFGVLQGLAFYYEMFTKNFRAKLARAIPAMIYNKLSILLTFSFFCFTSIFFRADNIIDGFHIAGSLDNGLLEFISNFTKKLLFEFSLSPGAEVLKELDLQPFDFVILMFAIFTMFQFEKFGRDGYFWEVLEKAPLIARWTVYAFIFTFILMYGEFNIQEFIYFQF
jgi:D-alanyl-lipoteichoic acid acyltransferase DltB (MBOAT superfamily)